MVHILMVMALVAVSNGRPHYDLRSLGEFRAVTFNGRGQDRTANKTSLEMCESAAVQLKLDHSKYTCVQSQ